MRSNRRFPPGSPSGTQRRPPASALDSDSGLVQRKPARLHLQGGLDNLSGGHVHQGHSDQVLLDGKARLSDRHARPLPGRYGRCPEGDQGEAEGEQREGHQLQGRVLSGIPVKGDRQWRCHLASEPEVVHKGPAAVEKGLDLARDRGDVYRCRQQDAVRFEHFAVQDLHVVPDAAVVLLDRNRDDVVPDLFLYLVYAPEARLAAGAVLDPVIAEMNEFGRRPAPGRSNPEGLFEEILAVAFLDRRPDDAEDLHLQISSLHDGSMLRRGPVGGQERTCP